MESKQRSGRAVYCTGLENRRPFTRSGGSNPSSSASSKKPKFWNEFGLFVFPHLTKVLISRNFTNKWSVSRKFGHLKELYPSARNGATTSLYQYFHHYFSNDRFGIRMMAGAMNVVWVKDSEHAGL